MLKSIREFVKCRTTRSFRLALRRLYEEYSIQRRHRRGLRAAQLLTGHTGLKLNLGCGGNPKVGWSNIDLSAGGACLSLDIREVWPFSDKSASFVYAEHLFEHLTYPDEATLFLREAYRVLEAHGLIRLGVPDTRIILEAYVRGDHAWFRWLREQWHPAWCNTPLHQVNYHFRQGDDHKYAYDADTLCKMLIEAGFVEATSSSFDVTIDSPEREIGTLYVTARKPAITSKTS